MALIFCSNMFAQESASLDASVVFRGGYNILEKQPVTGVSLFGSVAFVRFACSFNYAFDKNNTPFPAFSPSIGLTYGYKNEVYFMLGAQPWGVYNKKTNKMFSQDTWRMSLELGYDIPLSRSVFFNIGAYYLLPIKDTETEHYYQNLSLMTGFGFRL